MRSNESEGEAAMSASMARCVPVNLSGASKVNQKSIWPGSGLETGYNMVVRLMKGRSSATVLDGIQLGSRSPASTFLKSGKGPIPGREAAFCKNGSRVAVGPSGTSKLVDVASAMHLSSLLWLKASWMKLAPLPIFKSVILIAPR